MKVTCEVENFDTPRKPSIKIHSHWSNASLVEIEFANGERVTVSAHELKTAANACSTL